jgi:hypothetical protein
MLNTFPECFQKILKHSKDNEKKLHKKNIETEKLLDENPSLKKPESCSQNYSIFIDSQPAGKID